MIEPKGSFPRLRRVISPIDSFFSEYSQSVVPSFIDATIVAESSLMEQDELLKDSDEDIDEEGFDCELCGQFVRNNFEYEHHLETLHHHVCSECGRVFPSAFFLSVHLEENHDSFFSVMTLKTNCYQCLVEDKSICNAKFRTSTERDEHMRKDHLYKSDFCFENVGLFVDGGED